MNLAELRRYRDRILAIATHYDAEDVRVFGSVARGEETESSDIDFLVKYRAGASLMDAAAIWSELQDMLKCKVDIVSERTVPPGAQHIFTEAVPL